MIILNSNAQNIYWVGRYLSRIQHLCGQFPFQDDVQALQYAHAFCLPAFNACSLNELILSNDQPASFFQQFEYVKNNIQDLRGVLSVQAYSELKQMVDTATQNAGLICTVVDECSDILEAENEDIFLFFSLGQYFENLDREIRLNQDVNSTINSLSVVIELLKSKGWDSLDEAWQHLLAHPNANSFYQLNDQVQCLFEVDA
ncbi:MULTISPECIES: alpha-E domain-containing protein [unclassified Acinetobacter]|uniref:alpha-E domain-containing protein n=1 Tax=unclassified Acinetobacter TaxID=196816 RepID=UPI0008BF9937|nr:MULTISPECIES: alpha-E domain-containing protein [unclassified Acinetobacter]SEL30670.1 A predicted alpha-helical domain with a conserved ER motif [Acinetobacter sp. DSM 11652]